MIAKRRKKTTFRHRIETAISIQFKISPLQKKGFGGLFVFNGYPPSLSLPDRVSDHLLIFAYGLDPRSWLEAFEFYSIRFYLLVDALLFILGVRRSI